MSAVPFALEGPVPRFAIIEMIGGDNNLTSFVATDLEEMRLGLPADALVLALTDHLGQSANVVQVRGGEIKTVEELGEIDTGDPDVLGLFLSRALASIPHSVPVAVGFWDHGSGVFDEDDPNAKVRARALGPGRGPRRRLFMSKLKNGVDARAMLHDDTNGGVLTNLEAGKMLRKAFAASGRDRVTAIFSDTCLNGMIEVLTEFEGLADVVIGSEDLEPGDGWDYNGWLSSLGEGQIDGARFGKTSVAAFEQFYEARTALHPCTLGAFSGSSAMVVAFKAMVDAADAGGRTGFEDLEIARRKSQSFDRRDTYDLLHFATRLQGEASSDALRNAARDLAQATDAARVAHCALGDKVANSNGLAFWFPANVTTWQNDSATYSELKFDLATGWATYLGKQFR